MEDIHNPIKQHLSANITFTRKQIMINNFLGGLAWGFGTVVGATVVVAIIISVLKGVGLFNTLKPLLQPQSEIRNIQRGQPSPPPRNSSLNY